MVMIVKEPEKKQLGVISITQITVMFTLSWSGLAVGHRKPGGGWPAASCDVAGRAGGRPGTPSSNEPAKRHRGAIGKRLPGERKGRRDGRQGWSGCSASGGGGPPSLVAAPPSGESRHIGLGRAAVRAIPPRPFRAGVNEHVLAGGRLAEA